MASQGFLVDQSVMAKAATDFEGTADSIRALMKTLDDNVNSTVGAAQAFNGSARLAFDQNRMLLNEKIQKANLALAEIAQGFRSVMGTHTQQDEERTSKINQVSAGSSGAIVSGLNG
ncbi:WXG100 family type VII secretion target [Plantactinospora solaniradicis]|uniref:WXG100 family type VII secretion target n=1 Tax=Plantactinospora solaniradicis TaxID=1723736 RepID=A0ABW1KAG1_9ACTN